MKGNTDETFRKFPFCSISQGNVRITCMFRKFPAISEASEVLWTRALF